MVATGPVAAKWLAFSDIPDPDNFMMHAYLLLKTHEGKEMVAVIFSPRPVSWGTLYVGSRFPDVMKQVDGPLKIVYPLMEEKDIPKVPAEYKKWFTIDKDLRDEEIRKDTELYMRWSAVRFALFCKAHGIGFDRFRIYQDQKSMEADTPILCGIHHIGHKQDWRWGLNHDEEKKCKAIFDEAEQELRDSNEPHSETLRRKLKALVKGFIDRGCELLGVPSAASIINPLDKLIELNKKESFNPRMLIGGPFTEPLKYLKETGGKIADITAMAGSWTKESNLFGVQFNFFAAPKSAWEFMHYVQDHKIRVVYIPTEAAKECVWTWREPDISKISGVSPECGKIIVGYTHGADKYFAFDLIAGVLLFRPELLLQGKTKSNPLRKVWFKKDLTGSYEDSTSVIEMFFNDEEVMKDNRHEMIEECAKVLGQGQGIFQRIESDVLTVPRAATSKLHLPRRHEGDVPGECIE